MINKISDFQIPYYVLNCLCRQNGLTFVDTDVVFESDEPWSVKKRISIKNSKNISHTNYLIIYKYLILSKDILGTEIFENQDELNDFLLDISNMLRSLVHSTDSIQEDSEIYVNHLYSKPLVWMLFKNIICPMCDIEIKNTKVVFANYPYIDICKYFSENSIDIDGKKNDESFIYINEIDNQVFQNAFLFMETFEDYDINAFNVIKKIFSTDVYERFVNLLYYFLDSDENVRLFISIISNILDIDLDAYRPVKKMSQVNPHTSSSQSNWWFMGLIESMLEPVRGDNYEEFQNLESYKENFWNKVENYREKKGFDKVSFEDLLRLKDTEYSNSSKKDVTLQGMLSSDRIW